MSSMAIGWIVFACVFGGALLGMLLRSVLPEHHLTQDSKDVVKLGMGLIATMAALVLGLLIASAKSAFDIQNNEFKQAAANIVLLDRALAHYGPETQAGRDQLRRAVAFRLAVTWPEDASTPARLDTPETTPRVETIEAGIRELSPKTDGQRWVQSRALQIVGDLQQTRWLLIGGAADSIPMPFLVVLVFWITVIFASFGLFAPPNGTVVSVLFVCALSIAASIVLIVEMGRPFEGILKISSAPLRYTLSHLGQ
ncbi:MAG: hypothetical protein E6J56_22230 [Deltaproteobacteria bacterium]|nr:MAG: hypothetical protein E6J77_18940 [Deltaproteobacteria bacterium]TMB50113.1 MAG: hypothetical protein E6J56_22230 [Deltaproteobacteria bacterium]